MGGVQLALRCGPGRRERDTGTGTRSASAAAPVLLRRPYRLEQSEREPLRGQSPADAAVDSSFLG